MKTKITAIGLAAFLLHATNGQAANTTLGTNVGSNWDGMGNPLNALVVDPPPSIAGTPNFSMYPVAAGASHGAFTLNYLQDLGPSPTIRPRLRSWMGWFSWSDGLTPPGINPGIFTSGASAYGTYAKKGWDYFNYQWLKTSGTDSGRSAGTWNPIRLDQQPLYLTPLVLNYNWAPALFGYESAPLSNFPLNTFYMSGTWSGTSAAPKRIVRGVNVGGSIPFFYQYGNRLTDPIPPSWRQSWLYLATRPLETTVIVPSNVEPAILGLSGTSANVPNKDWVPKKNGLKDPFPYPVWRETSTPQQQTPFALLIDKMGDFHADLIWEATNPREGTYDQFRYKRTPFSNVSGKLPVGTGDYLKMTVAQGSPFVWCEMNDSAFAIFYNLIRTNLPFQTNNNQGTGAGTVLDGPFDVPGTQGVKFVLLVGDHVNPNQWYQESEPWYARLGNGATDSNQPGGFNPPPLNNYLDRTNNLISTPGQHNYVYTAVYYRPDQVETVRLNNSGNANNGTDTQGNPFFYLKFKNPTGKNWFVVGKVPEMRYYGVTPDGEPLRQKQAVKWAQAMGQYAFNFMTGSKVSYSVKNMNKTETSYSATLVNPYTELPASARPLNAAGMTNKGTVLALQPHQYQPITLGPDYTKTNKASVVWNPLLPGPKPLFNGPPDKFTANKNTKSSLEVWDYWSIKGSLKSFVMTGTFTTAYPFQNFLPVMPPPKWERNFKQTGIAAVNIISSGTGFKEVKDPPHVDIVVSGTTPGNGAGAKALLDTNTGSVLQVDVVSPGSDYPNGMPPDGVTVNIAPPAVGRQATAYVQTGGGNLLAVFMKDKGFGYSSIITVDQDGLNNYVDAPVILPRFDQDGNLIPGPATIRESGAGFDFSGSTQPIATLYSGSGSGAILQVVPPGTIYNYKVPVLGGGVTGVYPSADANPPNYVKVHVLPPSGTQAPQEATATFSRTRGDLPVPVKITNPGLYSGTVGVYATYQNSAGDESVHLPVTFEADGPNFKVKSVEGATLYVDAPASVTFHNGTVITPPEAVVYPYFSLRAVATQMGTYSGTAGFTATFNDDSNTPVTLKANWANPNGGFIIDFAPVRGYVTQPKEVIISGGIFTQPAKATVYPMWEVSGVVSGTNLATGYNQETQVAFTGSSFSTDPAVKVPKLTFTITGTAGGKGTITKNDIQVADAGAGLAPERGANFWVEGGLGIDAMLAPVIVDGKLSAVRIIQKGNNYLSSIVAQVTGGGGSGAKIDITVSGTDGSIAAATVSNPGSGYTSSPKITLYSSIPTNGRAPDPVFWDNPKGAPAQFVSTIESGTIKPGGFNPVVPPPDKVNNIKWAQYFVGTENQSTANSVPASLVFNGTPQFPTYTSASLWYAVPAPAETGVEQVLYSSLIATYANLSSKPQAPFGGAYLGISAPDGYGLGGQISASAKFVGDLYNMQQKFKTIPNANPMDYATSAALAPFAEGGNDWEFKVQQANNPYFTLTGALKTSVQSLQRSISLLFTGTAQNAPTDLEKPTTWQMNYFSQFDPGVGRVVINPTATQPAWGINSSTDTPGDVSSLNGGKVGLSQWQKGMLWSGFGVSDQWNDMHYFYGYYLSSAALAGLFDRAWETTPGNLGSAPDKLWAGKGEMGTSIDQLLMTLAFDPDTTALQDPNSGYYRNNALTYQKMAFFDQWNGHPWATGAMPGTTVAALDFDADPFGYWRSFGTDSDKFNGENENSIFEGVQAWSAAILWGGATDRKSIVDLGIYLYSTNIAAADSYFLDKNFNMVNDPINKYSWVPVTTIDASLVSRNGNNDVQPYPPGQTAPRWPAGTDYASANPKAFYTAPEFFSDSKGNISSPGQSLLKKAESTLNNFFYSYPTGSRFIQAYPPTPWTMGMVRDTNYMKKWAGSMMQQDWQDARNSALYQPADWLGMAMTSALAGVPYNPGDIPYPMTGTAPSAKKVDKYLNRLWSSWVTPYAAPGSNASRTPPFLAHSVMTFLLALDDYGVPDWTYIGVATSSDGTENNTSVVFTAAFTIEPKPGDTSVTTTFVAFNPGWETRYAKFQRLDATGNVNAANVSSTLTIKPKETVVKTVSFSIGTGMPLVQGPSAEPKRPLQRLRNLLNR
jgi:hypothetical protein